LLATNGYAGCKIYANFKVWFRGRVDRQRSAKPFTVVRIYSEPLSQSRGPIILLIPEFTVLLGYEEPNLETSGQYH
jgi:hypothetical protein